MDLTRRLGLATPDKTVKGTLFRAAFAELERQAPEHPKLAELKERHVKSAWRDFSNFPVADYLKLVYDGADLIEPKAGNPAEALAQLGGAVTMSFLNSAVGRLALTMGSGKDPIALLSYAPGVYGVSANYGQRTFVRLGATQGLLKIRNDFMPADYHFGVIRTGVKINGHTPKVELQKLGLLDVDIVVTWQADGAAA